MATFGRSKIAWIVGRNMTSFGSNRLLLNPSIPEQAPHLFNTRLISSSLSQQWKLGSKTINVGYPIQNINSLLVNLEVGRRYYNADRFGQVSAITSANLGKVVIETTKRRIRLICILISVLAGVGALAVYLSKLETVPYSKRTRFLLRSRKMEKEVEEHSWEEIKEENKDKILPETHPMSVRVRLITNRLIEALERDLRDDKVWGAGPFYALSIWKLALKAYWKGQSVNELRATEYMDHVDCWKVFVVDDPEIRACSDIAGKIVVKSGLLQAMESDAQLASVIAHEIGHVVARHVVEAMERRFRFAIPRLLVFLWDVDDSKQRLLTDPFLLSLERKFEYEADHIGLLLMASAGYHPRVALEVFEKFLKSVSGDDYMLDDDSEFPHPSGKKRIELRAEAEEEAMAFYRKAVSKGE